MKKFLQMMTIKRRLAKMKIKIKSNVNFSKLLSNLPKIMDKTMNHAAKDGAEASRFNIDNEIDFKGTPYKPLHRETKQIRKMGKYWEGDTKYVVSRQTGYHYYIPVWIKENLSNVGGTKPLKYTGSLYNSIKAKKNAMELLSYGGKHDTGYPLKKWNVPARRFIHRKVTPRTEESFVKLINKGLKK